MTQVVYEFQSLEKEVVEKEQRNYHGTLETS